MHRSTLQPDPNLPQQGNTSDPTYAENQPPHGIFGKNRGNDAAILADGSTPQYNANEQVAGHGHRHPLAAGHGRNDPHGNALPATDAKEIKRAEKDISHGHMKMKIGSAVCSTSMQTRGEEQLMSGEATLDAAKQAEFHQTEAQEHLSAAQQHLNARDNSRI
jgi:hypothetical protein